MENPDPPELESARAHLEAGSYLEAVSICQKALRKYPESAGAHHLFGQLLYRTGHLRMAMEALKTAVQLDKNHAGFFHDLGIAQLAAGLVEEAIWSQSQAVVLDGEQIAHHIYLGLAKKAAGDFEGALAAYGNALKIEPENPDIHNNSGNVLLAMGQIDAAIAAYEVAIRHHPTHADAFNNLAIAEKSLGKTEAALDHFWQAIQLEPASNAYYSNFLFTLQYDPHASPATLARELRLWNELQAAPLEASQIPHHNDRHPERRLRIGYVSPDFRNHSAAHFLVPLLENHDHSRHEVYCYSSVLRPDRMTDRLKASADCWRDVNSLGNEALASQIRNDQIDILIDLSLHMAQNRLQVFARKPAPIQVSWLAYPGSSGLKSIDYRISDFHLDPPDLGDPIGFEIPIRMPHSFWCYDPLDCATTVGPAPAASSGTLTFGCLTNPGKIHPGVVALWSDVLREVENSSMVILAHEGRQSEEIIGEFNFRGIAADRIRLVRYKPRDKYLLEYHGIDIGLDTIPYNGHTSTLDSLWMGVPVITLEGMTAVGRAGRSILMNLDLPDLVASSPKEFVGIATRLATDIDHLSELRSHLRPRLQRSPLMNGSLFARTMERAYRAMWHEWCCS